MKQATNSRYRRNNHTKHHRKLTRGYFRTRSTLSNIRYLPSHLVLCPTMNTDGREITTTNIEELHTQAKGLERRLKRKRSRVVETLQLDKDKPSVHQPFFARHAKKLYVIGHCNGSTFGSKNSGFIDFNPESLADWLITTGLMRSGITIKIMACYTASTFKNDHEPFAKLVADALAKKGLHGITVRGYDGRTKEAHIAGMLHSACTPLWSYASRDRDDEHKVEEGETIQPIRASAAAYDFSI